MSHNDAIPAAGAAKYKIHPYRSSELRQADVKQLLVLQGRVMVAQLAVRFSVSEMTVGRDLIEMELNGDLQRIHGGAVSVESAHNVTIDHVEPGFESRLLHNHSARMSIAAAAVERIKGARTLALDVGSTTFLAAQLLSHYAHLTIFTNSVRVAHNLTSAQATIYMAGGRMRQDEMSTGGSAAVRQFSSLWFDVAFVGVSGLTPEGIYDYSFDDADLKRLYLNRSSQKIVLCDSSKFQRMSLVHLATLEHIDILITEKAPPSALSAILDVANVEVIIAPSYSA